MLKEPRVAVAGWSSLQTDRPATLRGHSIFTKAPSLRLRAFYITRNAMFCELVPDIILFSRHHLRRSLHRRTEIKNERHRSEFQPWHADDELLTNSMILAETYVDPFFGDVRNEIPKLRNASRGILNSSILSPREDLLFWVMTVLALLFL